MRNTLNNLLLEQVIHKSAKSAVLQRQVLHFDVIPQLVSREYLGYLKRGTGFAIAFH
jgi:hypothetical protein